MWAFPKAKPQFFSPSPRALGGGMCCYSFGRRIPRWQQSLLAAQPLVPVIRGAFVSQVQSFQPVCGWHQWNDWEDWLRRREARVAQWVYLRSQWRKARSSAIGLGRTSEPHVFVTVEPQETAIVYPSGPSRSFRIPAIRDRAVAGEWLLRTFDAVPRFHRTARWDPVVLCRVSEETSELLERERLRPDGVPAHWRPMHGDFVPWNLREDRHGVLWLLDWEDAAWGPPSADLVRYAVAYQSIHVSHPTDIARTVRQAFPAVAPDVMSEAALFWTTHPNLQRPDARRGLSKGQLGDYLRSRVEYEALTRIVHSAGEA